jgi:sugar lactone lactonase YvrE
MNRLECFALVLLSAAGALRAGQTRTWSQGGYADFEKGVIRNLSLRSDGVITLAPRSRELLDTSSPYLWALARDSQGNLYAGGGTGARLHRIEPNGKSRVVAELDGLEIHGIAVDRQDRVYAATSPDGKVYRIASAGKPEVFFDPKSKYIWGLAFGPSGDLFVATGDRGEIFRVAPDGKGSVFFRTDETHVRSLAVDPKGALVVGTEPGGLVIRVSASGEGFVLYQMAKKEVTAVAVAPDGTIYASAVGAKPAVPSGGSTPLALPPQIPIAGQPAGGIQVQVTTRPAAPPPASVAPAAQPLIGGSEVCRIEPNGNPRRVWTHPQDVVYALAIEPAGRVLVGAGNKGNIYRIESPTRYTSLLHLPSTQITAFVPAPDGRVFAATGNIGKVYEIGAAPEKEGAIESDVFDAGLFSTWGRLTFDGKANGGAIAVSTRSGNHDQPQKYWSQWSGAVTSDKGERIASPAARFVQWRATLTAGPNGSSPEVYSVDVAYLTKNREPRIDEVEITPVNYRFPAPSSSSSAASTLSLPAMGRGSGSSSSLSLDSSSGPTLTYAKGVMSARWLAGDPNGDTLLYTVEIRGSQETRWKPVKEKVREKYVSWDSTAFADGEYRIRVTASDSPSNPPGEALAVSIESDPFFLDNTPPRIAGLAASRSGNRIEAAWHAADALNNLKKAEYSLDGGEWTIVAPVGGLSDSLELDYKLTLDVAGPGEHTVAVRVQDDYDNQSAEKVVVK